MEQPTFFDEYYPIDLFAFEFNDVDFKSTPESCYSSHNNNKRFYSETTQNSFPVESPDQSVVSTERPTKQLKTKNSSPKIISFENSNTSSDLDFASVISQGSDYDDKSFLNNYKRENKAATAMRNQSQARDHVIAERKRRENLTQKFIALSAILPGLKKNDKATILEDAVKQLKQLQEKVKNLEEEVADRTVESAVFVKRSIFFADDDHISSCDNSLPEIEAKVSGKDILFRIHCNKHSGRTTTAILTELEKHHLTVQSSTSLPFGNNTLDITIVAQMNKEYCLTINDLIRNLSQTLRKLN